MISLIKNITYFLFVVSVFTLASCQNPSENNLESTGEAPADTPYFEPGDRYVQLVADSLRTPEDIELIEKLKELPNYVKAENHKAVFTLTRDEVLAMGIPGQYYTLVQKDIVNINKMRKENKEINVDSIFKAP